MGRDIMSVLTMGVLIIVASVLAACQGNTFVQSVQSDTDHNSASADADGADGASADAEGGSGKLVSYGIGADNCKVTPDGVDPCTSDDDDSIVIIKGSKQFKELYGGRIPADKKPYTIGPVTVNPTFDANPPYLSTLGSGTHETTETMVEVLGNHPAVSHQQVTRRSVSDSFDQPGLHANQHSKTFTQTAQSRRRVLDILLVVDSSGSMSDEQAILANQLPTLMHYVRNEDWQVGVVNTEPACAMKGVTKSASVYQRLINVGVFGGIEYAVYNAVKAMKGKCGYSNWLRANSTIAVIILTDEPHQCPSGCSPSHLTSYLQSIRPNNYGVYGLVHPSDGSWGNIFNASGSVQSRSYASVLSRIGSNIQQVLEKTFPLSSVPDSNSVRVTVNGRSDSRYTLNGQTVLFDRGYVPPSGSTIVASWTTGFRAFKNSWSLSTTPLNGVVSAVVTKSGHSPRTLTTNDYSISGRTITLPASRIEQLMPQGSRLTVTYKEHVPLRRDFSLSSVPGGLAQLRSEPQILVNNQAQTKGRHYDRNGVAIRFRNNYLPPEGATITVGGFRYRIADKLRYSVPLHVDNQRIYTTCSVSSRTIPCTHDSNDGTITISSNNFRAGQQLKVTQNLQHAEVGGAPLDRDFLINTVALTTNGQVCRGNEDPSLNQLEIIDNVIQLDARASCPAIRNMRFGDRYTVKYRYQRFNEDQFVFPDEVYESESYKFELYLVFVEDIELAPEKYDIVDRQVEFTERLPSGVQVEVKLWLLPAL